ncbi:MAG: ribosomal protein S18-alanine N-acetyltransferase [Alphaproteobacteria bacterium]
MTTDLNHLPGYIVGNAVIGDLFERAFDEPYGEAAVEDLTKSPATWSMVAVTERDGADMPVGFIIGMTAADTSEIYSIGVPPEYRGRGYAKNMLQRAFATCRTAGAETMFLEVAADNGQAIGLYRRVGFEQKGLRKNYYRRGRNRIDALVMGRNL